MSIYRIFGAELSPYSVKVRSYFRYKGIPHEWLAGGEHREEMAKFQKVPLIPVVVTPDGRGLQDSTPIIETLEAEFPEPSIHPGNAALAFLSALIEEFADEWAMKWMFHYRWSQAANIESASQRIAQNMQPGLPADQQAALARQVAQRMTNRLWFVGSSAETGPQIEASLADALTRLEAHLQGRDYLFGARPAFGDFGLAAEIYEVWSDPVGAEKLAAYPQTEAWMRRMLDPGPPAGEFEPWANLEATLMPLLSEQVGGLFLPWIDANDKAIAAGEEEFRVKLRSGVWTQKPQKYNVRSLRALRQRFAALDSAVHAELNPILDRAGCLAWLKE